MKAAIVEKTGKNPCYGDFAEPCADANSVLVEVRAAALSNLVRGKAAGTHYTSTPKTPFVPGVDGVGILQNGNRVYFFSPPAPFGAMAERVALSPKNCIPLPAAIDEIKAAALANPGMSSVAALRYRAKIESGQTVLINGATGVSGRLAVQISKRLGAGRVIATGRDKGVLKRLEETGADVCIPLSEDREEQQFAFMKLLDEVPVDIVLDYIWGPSMESFFTAAAKTAHDDRRLCVVQIGAMSAATLTMPASPLRSTGLVLMGSGIGSVSTADLIASIAEVFQMEAERPVDIDIEAVPLTEVESHWHRTTRQRLVFTT